MKKHSFKKSGTNFYKKRAGGGSKAIYKLYKKTDKLVRDRVPKIQGSNSILKPPTHKYHFYGLGANLPPLVLLGTPVLIGLTQSNKRKVENILDENLE